MTERFVAWAALAALILAGGACTETTYRVTKVISGPQSAGTWNGRTEAEVSRVWGDSAIRESDGLGGTIVSYMSYRRVETGEPIIENPDAVALVDAGGANVGGRVEDFSGPLKVSLEGKPLARFWIDARGVVYRYWFDDSVYKKDEKIYPPPRSEEE